jgi:hypothetical protein
MSFFVSPNSRLDKANKALDELKGDARTQAGQIAADYGRIMGQGAGAQDIEAFRQAAGELDTTVDPFGYDWDAAVARFSDPTVDAQVAAATKAIQDSAANRGGLFSSATGKAISDRAGQIAKQSIQEAMKMALQDKQAEADIWGKTQTLEQNAKQMQLNNLGQLAGLGQQGLTTQAQGTAQAKQSAFDTINSAKGQQIQNNLAKQSGWETFWNGIGDIAGVGADIASIFTMKNGGK